MLEAIDSLNPREYFAGLALQGLLASGDAADASELARRACKCADALIAELEHRSDGVDQTRGDRA